MSMNLILPGSVPAFARDTAKHSQRTQAGLKRLHQRLARIDGEVLSVEAICERTKLSRRTVLLKLGRGVRTWERMSRGT